MKQQSELLTAFYRAYLAWAESDKPSKYGFRNNVGMCANINRFISVEDPESEIMLEMLGQFTAAGMDESYPFNLGSMWDYKKEMSSHSATLNPWRMKWVREHAQ